MYKHSYWNKVVISFCKIDITKLCIAVLFQSFSFDALKNFSVFFLCNWSIQTCVLWLILLFYLSPKVNYSTSTYFHPDMDVTFSTGKSMISIFNLVTFVVIFKTFVVIELCRFMHEIIVTLYFSDDYYIIIN